MKVRAVPILLSMLATITLLFGGWFLYQKMQVEEPLRSEIAEMKSAKLVGMQVSQEQLNVQLEVTDPESFPVEYRELTTEIKRLAPGKAWTVEMTNQDPELTAIWATGIFDLTEAIELHQYSKIPSLLNDWKQTHQLDEAKARMDEQHVFIYLKRGNADFYKVVPRLVEEREVTARG
ncbi:hypothetical protein LOK74_09680 [Brevibacillus humidisoli]|uniref:hypothetical protein n=1 Tax=Brevibacillus humidisoli TaxID=2895522 RepID=UPI001E59A921|nr:hypothetical protein [Brevibacillus humidisoli]UFJ42736.1 hypothetical protein LOK74_09680 [Brevibacillus humidisoli]